MFTSRSTSTPTRWTGGCTGAGTRSVSGGGRARSKRHSRASRPPRPPSSSGRRSTRRFRRAISRKSGSLRDLSVASFGRWQARIHCFRSSRSGLGARRSVSRSMGLAWARSCSTLRPSRSREASQRGCSGSRLRSHLRRSSAWSLSSRRSGTAVGCRQHRGPSSTWGSSPSVDHHPRSWTSVRPRRARGCPQASSRSRCCGNSSRSSSGRNPGLASGRILRSCTICEWPPGGCERRSHCSPTRYPVRSARLGDELKWVADALGAVRDLDVQLDQVEAWERDLPPARPFLVPDRPRAAGGPEAVGGGGDDRRARLCPL